MRLTVFILCFVSFSLVGCRASDVPKVAPSSILLFNGTGASPNDVAAIEEILDSRRLAYSHADSGLLNAMTEPQLREYRLLIIAGGNFEKIGNGLTQAAAANMRRAVRGGLNYLGICAGGFLAGDSPYNGLNLTSGVRFGFYGAEARGVRKAVVAVTPAGSPALEQYWEDGPQFTGWGAVVAKYPDGSPAIVEGSFGNGWIVLSGVHAEAPESWRSGMTFTTPVSADQAYAATLIDAALNRTELPHY